MNEFIERALQHNQSVQIAKLGESWMQVRIQEVKAAVRPQVNVSGDYKRYFKIPGQVIPSSTFGGPEGEYQVLALGLPYPTIFLLPCRCHRRCIILRWALA